MTEGGKEATGGREKAVDSISAEHWDLLLWTDPIGNQSEVSIWRDKGEDSFRLPALEANAGVEAHVIEEPWVLGTGKHSKFYPRNNTPKEASIHSWKLKV